MVQGDPASKWMNWDLNPGLSGPKASTRSIGRHSLPSYEFLKDLFMSFSMSCLEPSALAFFILVSGIYMLI